MGHALMKKAILEGKRANMRFHVNTPMSIFGKHDVISLNMIIRAHGFTYKACQMKIVNVNEKIETH